MAKWARLTRQVESSMIRLTGTRPRGLMTATPAGGFGGRAPGSCPRTVRLDDDKPADLARSSRLPDQPRSFARSGDGSPATCPTSGRGVRDRELPRPMILAPAQLGQQTLLAQRRRASVPEGGIPAAGPESLEPGRRVRSDRSARSVRATRRPGKPAPRSGMAHSHPGLPLDQTAVASRRRLACTHVISPWPRRRFASECVSSPNLAMRRLPATNVPAL